MGWDALDGWVAAATGLHVPAAAGDDGACARLGARPRCSGSAPSTARAATGRRRSGAMCSYVGGNIRGHLDVRRTVRLRAKGATTAASVYRARELDNPVTRIIVAADRVLMRQVGRGAGARIASTACSRSSRRPSGAARTRPARASCTAMRYTPITRPFKWAAELSSRIVRQDPVATTALPGRVQGLVLDLDGIYRAGALNWARDGAAGPARRDADSGQICLGDGQRSRAARAACRAAPPPCARARRVRRGPAAAAGAPAMLERRPRAGRGAASDAPRTGAPIRARSRSP